MLPPATLVLDASSYTGLCPSSVSNALALGVLVLSTRFAFHWASGRLMRRTHPQKLVGSVGSHRPFQFHCVLFDSTGTPVIFSNTRTVTQRVMVSRCSSTG